MNAIPALVERAPVGMFRFELSMRDIVTLSALGIYLDHLGRHSLAVEIAQLSVRIHAAIRQSGEVTPSHFSWADWDHLMNRVHHAEEVSDALGREVRDLASRLWCGMTGDSRCPINMGAKTP